MTANRASNKKIIVLSNSIAGEIADRDKNDGDVPVWDEVRNKYIHKAANDHDHEIGNVALFFENQLI
jgi:hypothetical protein